MNDTTNGGLRRFTKPVEFEPEWREEGERHGLGVIFQRFVGWFIIAAAVMLCLPFPLNSPMWTAFQFAADVLFISMIYHLGIGAAEFFLLGAVPSWSRYCDKWLTGFFAYAVWAYAFLLPIRLLSALAGFDGAATGNWRYPAGAVAFGAIWLALLKMPGVKVWPGIGPLIGRFLPESAHEKIARLALRLQGIKPVDPSTLTKPGAGVAGSTVTPAPQGPAPAQAAPTPAPVQPKPFGLTLGTSTGKLGEMGHTTAMEPGQIVRLSQPDASQNIIIFGGIGSGKTTRMISPMMADLFRQDAGALIFDIKTDFVREVDYIAHMTGRKYEVVGDGGYACNLLAGLTPQVAGSFIASAFQLGGGGGGENAFWTDSAATLCTNVLRLLHAVNKFDLSSLYDYIFVSRVRNAINSAVDELLANHALDAMTTRSIITARGYFDDVFEPMEDKVKSNVKATVAQVLGPFRDPILQDAFCGADPDLPQVDFTDLVNKGSIFLVEIPQTKFGREGSKFVYLFVKLRFMMMMKERRMRPEWNQNRVVAFVCDEYQAIIDPISDTDFWDKSRSSKTVGIVSMQGFSSMLHSLKKHEVTDAVMQNFRQVIAFPTEDQRTIEKLSKILGHVDVEKNSWSENQGTSEGQNFQAYTPVQSGSNDGKSWGQSRSVSMNRQDLIDGQLFRQMGQNDFLAMLRLGGSAFDDVLTATPLFVPDDWKIRGGAALVQPTQSVADKPAPQPASESKDAYDAL